MTMHVQNTTTGTKEQLSVRKIGISKRKALFLETYVAFYFNVTEACSQLNINRSTFYYWQNHDPEFRKEFEDCQNQKKDFVESALMRKIKKGDPICTIFAAKCLLKSRGYIEQPTVQQIEVVISKEQRDAVAAGTIQEIRMAGKLNLPDDLQSRLLPPPAETPIPQAQPTSQGQQPAPVENPQPEQAPGQIGHGAEVVTDDAGTIVDVIPDGPGPGPDPAATAQAHDHSTDEVLPAQPPTSPGSDAAVEDIQSIAPQRNRTNINQSQPSDKPVEDDLNQQDLPPDIAPF